MVLATNSTEREKQSLQESADLSEKGANADDYETNPCTPGHTTQDGDELMTEQWRERDDDEDGNGYQESSGGIVCPMNKGFQRFHYCRVVYFGENDDDEDHCDYQPSDCASQDILVSLHSTCQIGEELTDVLLVKID